MLNLILLHLYGNSNNTKEYILHSQGFNRVRYTGKFRKYQPIHELCKMFLESLQIDMKHGQVNFRGFTWI